MEITEDLQVYSIGVVASLLGISVQALRLYEKEGLIIPFKKSSKHRLYSANDVIRLKNIINAIKEKKYSIPAIKAFFSLIPCWELLKCAESDRNSCEAFNGTSNPYWHYNHESSKCTLQNCIECEVYTRYYRCDKIKSNLLNN